jgi:hypothetical protein
MFSGVSTLCLVGQIEDVGHDRLFACSSASATTYDEGLASDLSTGFSPSEPVN